MKSPKKFSRASPSNPRFINIFKLTIFILMKIESDVIHFVSCPLSMLLNCIRTGRAEPFYSTGRAVPGRAEKSWPVRTSSLYPLIHIATIRHKFTH